MSRERSAQCQICVVGSANVDLTFRTSRLPAPGETIAGSSLYQGRGGKGANQAVAAARLGAQVAFVGRVGNDDFGRQAIEAYAREGIDTSYIHWDSTQPTGTAAILVDDNAENCIVVVSGANEQLSPDDVQAASAVIKRADVVLCQLETPVAVALEAFQMARAAGALTILTPAPSECVTNELLAICDVCVPNKTEISALVNQSVDSEQEAILAAKLLRKKGVNRVALTMGGEGVLILDDSGPAHIEATKVKAVDTTGAGDAYTAALAVSLADGQNFREAARRAGIIAAISVTRRGTQSAFPRLNEVSKWVTANG